MICHCLLTRTIIQKEAKAEQCTVAPVAVRETRWNGVVGKRKECTSSPEIILYCPKHIESTAQIVADLSGGGEAELGGQRKPINFGGDNKSGKGSMTLTMSYRSGSEVTEESSSWLGITAAISESSEDE